MGDEVAAETAKNLQTLNDLIDQLCHSKNVFQGWGPPMALFNTPPDSSGSVKTFIYISFNNDGIKPEGSYVHGAETFGLALASSIKAFDEWLQPRRTLAWRNKPELEKDPEGKWRVYWRCVQLDDGARSIAVDWHF